MYYLTLVISYEAVDNVPEVEARHEPNPCHDDSRTVTVVVVVVPVIIAEVALEVGPS